MPIAPGVSGRSTATIATSLSWRKRRTAITTFFAIHTTPTSGAGRAARAPSTTGSRTLAGSLEPNRVGNGPSTSIPANPGGARARTSAVSAGAARGRRGGRDPRDNRGPVRHRDVGTTGAHGPQDVD